MPLKILVDTACDLTPDEAATLGVELLPLKMFFGEEQYLDGYDLTHDQFFEMLVESNVLPTTSQLTPYEYEDAFRRATADGAEVICITLSAKLSGCYQSAGIAAQDFRDRVYIVDSENACVGERILAELAVNLREDGLSAKQIVEVLEQKKHDIRLVALLDTLEYLKKGGRISSGTAMAGSLLSIKPVISIVHGEITLLGMARGSKKGNNKLIEVIRQSGGIDFTLPFCLAYSGLSRHLLQKYIEDSAFLYEGKTLGLPISSIGCAVGTHIGPGAIAAAFFVRGEKNE